MKINKEQYDALVAKLDALQEANKQAGKLIPEAVEWRDKATAEGNAWAQRIEQGLDKLLQSHAALDDHLAEHHNLTMNGSAKWRGRLSRIEAKLDAQNARLTEIGLDVGLHFRPAKAKQPAKRAKRVGGHK